VLPIEPPLSQWQFPAPEGGGAVTVNYPFDLSVVEP
jgi:hypothetical protein